MSDIQRLVLPNGLNVVLCHAPRLKRCAASLRVAAGSHDVPQAWPGLAHFLEHLFFLGTERFAADQNLMAFVQRHGGQINASTRERTTDFFFELPPAAFAQGLERLCDMLAHPRMSLPDQLREREVLHAEFIAWTQDAKARQQISLLEPINPRHPIRGFHAGNRYSLSVPNPAFQQALHEFYQRFYQARQITLCLSGPQSLAELKDLAAEHGALLSAGSRVTQQTPPLLVDKQPDRQGTGVHLLFACEGLPEHAEEAVAFFCHCLMDTQPGGLVAELVRQKLIDSLKAAPLYQFAGQLLIDIDCTGAAQHSSSTIAALFFDWLAFFKTRWPELIVEYRRLQQRRLQTCGALELAHHFCRHAPEQNIHALNAVLDQLTPGTLLTAQPVDKLPCGQVEWCLPSANPFLLPASTGSAEAALFLRWQLQAAQPALWQMLNGSLQNLIEQARQAGVAVSFSAYGNYWELKLSGIHAPIPAIVEHALQLLQHPKPRHGQANSEPALIPIRQLIKALPDHFLNNAAGQSSDDFQAVWASSRCISFATGFPDHSLSLVNGALQNMPGSADERLSGAPSQKPGKRWQTLESGSSEDAVLVFCTAPGLSIEDEANWRLLAHLMQAPFYQRLRVELQLGYAVFSGLRQIAGRTGLLFGVQSPTCSAGQIVQHIETFIDELPNLIHNADIQGLRQTLAQQFDAQALPHEQAAELLWQARLAGHDEGYVESLQKTLLHLEKHWLLAAADQLNSARAGWLILANRPVPAGWEGSSTS
ncbi:pyrroloquinoline quinone biosynthesis protein PqqF [Pseudomonas cichorii]|uniref:pyrroloquinoline quinone biosynthesis protein PqqF n=1 Tax=Pseudomonas cichorii TaxID=36746 RepID=UPI001C8A664E|nr:pyrroloquinoline quinone biosynthesis protein PqqF [Pseudomonas cichorii]MBX8515713.1 pyrroloquinoline quinone biosynthesis protein PqqF [Pseudomonas cichorii]